MPELATQAIFQACGMKYQVALACDSLAVSKAFLQRNVHPNYLLGDRGERVFRTASIAATAADGEAPQTNALVICLCTPRLWSCL